MKIEDLKDELLEKYIRRRTGRFSAQEKLEAFLCITGMLFWIYVGYHTLMAIAFWVVNIL